MRTCKFLLAFLCVSLLWIKAVNSADPTTLELVDDTGSSNITVTAGEPFTIQVRVDDASVVAGASFTVNFGSSLTLSSENPVTSVFFDTFVNQGLKPPEDPYVTIPGDTKEYYSPIVEKPATSSVMIAAARFNNGTGTNEPIFTLHFTNGVAGVHPISIVQSVISNTDAGYSELGDPIPYLVGINGDSYPAFSSITTSGATVTVEAAFIDTDSDGIDDNWELSFDGVNSLDVLTVHGDYDGDGYSDVQEYINSNSSELDPDGNPYDPTVANAPSGTGYVEPVSGVKTLPAINFLLMNDEN